MTVHALHNGRALCGKPGAPGDWPEGERWHPAGGWPIAQRLAAGNLCPTCDRLATGREADLYLRAQQTAQAARDLANQIFDKAAMIEVTLTSPEPDLAPADVIRLERKVRDLLRKLASVVPEHMR